MLRINLILLLLAVLCGIGTVSSNHRARKSLIEIEREQAHMRDLEVEWGQLQLEQSTWANHVRIESIARNRLHMGVPSPAQTLTIDPVETPRPSHPTARQISPPTEGR